MHPGIEWHQIRSQLVKMLGMCLPNSYCVSNPIVNQWNWVPFACCIRFVIDLSKWPGNTTRIWSQIIICLIWAKSRVTHPDMTPGGEMTTRIWLQVAMTQFLWKVLWGKYGPLCIQLCFCYGDDKYDWNRERLLEDSLSPETPEYEITKLNSISLTIKFIVW